MSPTLTKGRAETIALQGVAFLLQDQRNLERFITESGFEPADFRKRLNEPTFLASVCVFLLGDDALTLDFCRSINCRPEALHQVRHTLEQWGKPD